MIQLKIYPNVQKLRSQQLFLDLYDTEPIKLTLSIEDITNADATSVFSRTFKVPATRHNNEFFKNVFEVNGVDFDVTVKKPAEILVDGAEFRQGHIRLQKIYVNQDLDKTDYELLFLGETRDFSTVIGDKPLCELIMPDLQARNLDGTPRNPTITDIEQSWQAFPQDAQVDGNGLPNAGLAYGNIIYPLIDHGNLYEEDGSLPVVWSDISVGASQSFTGTSNNNNYPLPTSRLKPMIRAKRVWDQIFEDAGYTYTSDFINSPKFHQMYMSAFGNEALTGYSTQGSGANLLHSEYNTNTPTQYFGDYLYLPNNIFDPGNNFQVGTANIGSRYITPATAIGGDPQKYKMAASAFIYGYKEVSCPSFCTAPVAGRLEIYNISTGQVLKQSGYAYGVTVTVSLDTEIDNITINQGDQLAIRVTGYESTQYDEVHSITWQIMNAPGTLLPSTDLDCEYKQIDYIKDVLKMFRLVMAPDRNDTKNFIIEPWQTYINSGDLHDWSHKLVQNKDQVLEPLFNTQSEEITFSFQEDEDFANVYHQEQYKHPFGYLEFDSNNELLKGTRSIETEGVAPTPLATIRETVNTNHTASSFIIPQIYANESEGSSTEQLPIKPKTRFLFYNGLQPVPALANGSQIKWFLGTTSNYYDTYPLVSSFENWPQTQNGLNLNWYNDINYWVQNATNQIFNVDGETLYDQYWSRYINSLYNKFSRRMTAYFVLNNVDLQDLSFDDTIFVNGKYWRPEKIIDVNIGERTEVKVQLISANDYVPPVYIDEQLTGFFAGGAGTLCGCDGSITVQTNGATPFTWSLDNGRITGQATTTGPNPQTFTIDGLCADTYDLYVEDDLGRSATQLVTVPDTGNPPVVSTHTQTDDTSCGTTNPCTGSITVTPSGGSGTGYTVTWMDGVVQTSAPYERTGLCGESTWSWTITDSEGCESEQYSTTILCSAPVTVHRLAQHLNCAQSSTNFVYAATNVSYAPGTTVDLVEIPGCFYVVDYTYGTPLYTIANTYTDCVECEGITPPQIFKAESCNNDPFTLDIFLDASTNLGLTIGQIINIQGSRSCYEVTELLYGNETVSTVTQVWESCEACNGTALTNYIIEGCSGFTPDTPDPTGGEEGPYGQIVNNNEIALSELYLEEFTFQDDFNTDACQVNGLVMTGEESDAIVPAGWYWFRPEIRFENLVALPANTTISIVRIFDDAVTPNDFGEVVEVLEEWPIENYGAGEVNDFVFSSRSSHYLPEGSNQRFGIAINLPNGETCVQGGGTGLDYAIDTSYNSGSLIQPRWLGDFAIGTVMSSSGTLQVGDVVTVNEAEAEGCFEVIGQASPDAIVQYTYNEDNGIYESCESCTGGVTEQTCHTVTAGTSGAEISWYYDDGTGQAAYTQGLSSGQVVTICAIANSIQVILNDATIVNSGELCSKYTDPVTGTVGTTCDTPTIPGRACYTLSVPSTSITRRAEFGWFENNVRYTINLRVGEVYQICADLDSPEVLIGTGTIEGGTELCTSVSDCVANCYTYSYNGPKGTNLAFEDCDGNRGYYFDVYTVALQNGGVLPDCIAKVLEGTAILFLTQEQICV